MDLSLTPEQEMLKAAASRFVSQEYPKETLLQIASPDETTPLEPWGRLATTGWLGILIPEQYGGEGGSFTDAGVLFEELGRGPVPGPHLTSAVLSALAILEGGTEEQKRDWLPRIASGDMRLVPAITERDYGWDERDVRLTAQVDGDGLRLNGSKAYVYDGETASHYLVAVRSEESEDVGLVIVPADAPGVRSRGLPGFAWNLAEVRFDNVAVESTSVLGGAPTTSPPEEGNAPTTSPPQGENAPLTSPPEGGNTRGGWPAWQRAVAKAIPVISAYQVGGCQAVYEVSVDYSRTRIQFGTPIGRFQRVQDQIIALVNHLDAARLTTYEALWKLDVGRDAASSISLAKAVASEGYYEACNYAHEVHAGVGSMTEYGLTLHTAASRTLYHFLGDPKQHRRELATALGL